MKKKFLLLSLSLLGAFALPAGMLTQAATLTQKQQAAFPTEYEHGHYDGHDDATANKCNYRNSPGAYENWYYEARQNAITYMNQAQQRGDNAGYEFWSGYYDGLESGYYTQVVCTGGGGTGGGGPLEPEPYIPN